MKRVAVDELIIGQAYVCYINYPSEGNKYLSFFKLTDIYRQNEKDSLYCFADVAPYYSLSIDDKSRLIYRTMQPEPHDFEYLQTNDVCTTFFEPTEKEFRHHFIIGGL